MSDLETDFVHLARLALDGNTHDLSLLLRRTLSRISHSRPDLRDQVKGLMVRAVGMPTRAAGYQLLPVDADSRLELLRREENPALLVEPVWPEQVLRSLTAVVDERKSEKQLASAGLSPTKSMLFTGPPGVGKTLAARWLARALNRPLLTLDLAAVMSSFLGKTGNNIRTVLDFAQREPSVLLLDEFDAIAKRRDDAAEVGELKRLVTVLVQTVDEWPSSGLLIAATNHKELLDPAVWRRFDRVVQFPAPTENEIAKLVQNLIGDEEAHRIQMTVRFLSRVLDGTSFAEVTRCVTAARREALIHNLDLNSSLMKQVGVALKDGEFDLRLKIALRLESDGLSQREIYDATGIARDTLRKYKRSTSRSRKGA